jgi:DNA modification methylase
MTDVFPLEIADYEYTFSTPRGRAYCCDSRNFMNYIPDESVDLIVTSPPFALTRKKSYGNENADLYVRWFMDNFAQNLYRILKPTGSLVIEIGGAWNKGVPTRSLYQFELLIALCKETGFHLAQEFYWYNPAKMPSPAQWVNIERIRVKDAVSTIWWLSKTDRPKANNRHVLTPYKSSMKRLLVKGYNDGARPSGHYVSKKWGRDNGGAIPPNILEIANTKSNDSYLKVCRQLGLEIHPARFPIELPSFFIRFLTEPDDIVYDPFGGSCVTGRAAEDLSRYWFTSEISPEYVNGSQYRFFGFPQHLCN